MTVNPPEPKNFPATVTETTKTKTTKEHPNAVFYPDVEAVQLEVYRANVENRKPDFSNFPDNAVKAAGWDKKKRKPLADALPGAPLPTVVEQAPLNSHPVDGEGNWPQGTAPVEADPAKKGHANADGQGVEPQTLTAQDQAKQDASVTSTELSNEKAAVTVADLQSESEIKQHEGRDVVADKALAVQDDVKKAAKAESKPVKKSASPSRAKKAASARKAAK